MKGSLNDYALPFFCVLAGLAFQYSGLDVRLESLFYDPEHMGWPWRNAWFTKAFLHQGGHDLVVVIITGILVVFISSFFNASLKAYRQPTAFLILSSLTAVGIVGILKATTHMYTPWMLQDFGGKMPNIHLFDHVSSQLPIGHAFPSGHASSGFALLSLYFLARHYQHRYTPYLLTAVLMIGFIFGIGQQMRGAHMLSHDMFALAICWFSCQVWARLFFPSFASLASTDEYTLSSPTRS